MEIETIRKDAESAMAEILEKAGLKEGDLFIVGCSSSEIIGRRMGTSPDGETDAAVEAVYGVVSAALMQAVHLL